MDLTRTGNCFLLGMALLLAAPAHTGTVATDGVDDETRSLLTHAILRKLNELTSARTVEAGRDKSANYSQFFQKNDDGTYTGSAQVNTSANDTLSTERFDLTLVPTGDEFEVTDLHLVDTFTGLHRRAGGTCYKFEKFKFSREGLTMTASNGGVCEGYFQGEVANFLLMAPDLEYDYQVPSHVNMLQENHDFYALRDILYEDHSSVMVFAPDRFRFSCDSDTCEEILDSSFTGLKRVAPDARPTTLEGLDGISRELRDQVEDFEREFQNDIQENPFAWFRRADETGNRYFSAAVWKGDDQGLGITYDNWAGYEVRFWVQHRMTDPEAPDGTLFGYYTEETLKTTSFYDLERRDDQGNRWYDVFKVKADVHAGIDDAEMVSATVDYGLNVKHDLEVLPFFIATSTDRTDESYKRATLFVNSIRINGHEVTWVKTSSFGGIAELPALAKAGSKLTISVSFDTKAIRKFTPSYSELARFGWLPFVRFGDFVEDFEMTIHTPSQYQVLGVGHRIEIREEGDVLVTHWKADSPVVFPSVIFGKYFSDTPRFKAEKIDGTEIPVEVFVDTVSMMQLTSSVNSRTDASNASEELRSGAMGIRGKQLRAIAEQAANAINLYRELSGIDYPYGSLNIVNDPVLALYGQAPSSLIYLGSRVFRGEGEVSGAGGILGGGGGTSTAKFLKSVVAHEVGHQWWGSAISNANQRSYWFVETLAEYFSALYLEAVYGPKEYQEQVDEWRLNILRNRLKSSVQAADTMWTGESPGARQSLIYNKGPYAFHVMRETFGDEKFFPFLKTFSQELAAKQEIVTRDIQLAAEHNLGGVDENGNKYNVDLEWFFDQWIRGVGIPEFTLAYDVRRTEDGGYLVEGTVDQVIVIGDGKGGKRLEGKFYRGMIDLTIEGNKQSERFEKKLLLNASSTPFLVKVPIRPVIVAINRNGGMLALDVVDRSRR